MVPCTNVFNPPVDWLSSWGGIMRLRIGSFLYLGMIFFCSCGSPVSPFQPNVHEGGRAVAIAVNPANNLEMIVASETGGLFSTTTGGGSWQHIDTLKNYGVNDVAFAPGTGMSNSIV